MLEKNMNRAAAHERRTLMKKLISILLTLMLCALSVLAGAESTTYSADEVGVKFSVDTSGVEKPDLNASPRGLGDESGSKVTNEDGLYTTVLPSGTRIVLNAKGQSYRIFTQSFYASLDMYLLYEDDEIVNSTIQMLKDNFVEFLVWDSYNAFEEIQVRAGQSDSLTAHVRNLSMLSETEMNYVADAIANAWTVEGYKLHEINGTPWIQLGEKIMLTIVNSEYVYVVYFPKGETMTEDDFVDFNTFMGLLTVE